MDNRQNHCVSWIQDINIIYHGYQIETLCIIDTKQLLSNVNNTRHGLQAVHFSPATPYRLMQLAL